MQWWQKRKPTRIRPTPEATKKTYKMTENPVKNTKKRKTRKTENENGKQPTNHRQN